MIALQFWLSVMLIPVCSAVGLLGGPLLGFPAAGGSTGSVIGLFAGLVLSLINISAFARETPRPKEGSGGPKVEKRFPLINCLWGPLSLLAGAGIYTAVSTIAATPIFVPPLRLEPTLFPELATTLDKALAAFRIGIAIAATLALFAALIPGRRDRLTVSGVAWVPVLAATMPWFTIVLGLTHAAQVAFAATAVTLAGLACFIRANDEAAAAPTAGRISFFALEAVYVSFLSALAAVIVFEFISSRDGIGYAIVNAMQMFDTARAVSAVAVVWLAVAVLSFVVRCAQSIATRD
jgi:ABC-type nitrate/sulfonate/bicarbonate transport system permease component